MTLAPGKVAVIGAGQMGAGIAQVFAQAGHEAAVVDVAPAQLQKARSGIAASIEKLSAKGKLAEPPAQVLGRLRFEESLEACRSSQVVIEAAPESEPLKRDLFARLAKIVPADALVASNTSSISITRLGAAFGDAPRFLGIHFMNPVPLMALVEVIAGLATSEATVQRALSLVRELGKTPVLVRDAPGFVANRVLMPMINEAVGALAEGVSDAAGIDTIMKLGCGHPMGPLALADLIGLDTCLSILEVLHKEIGDPRYRPHPLLRRMIDAGRLGRKTGQGFFPYGA
ncbi:MAG: 3-hydroxybutyryl-CoA dehydrogenase [Planctomycetes bacterium]|nr:3-hydroxybutyryl-CoA dehydrogenase [Planctomycetota bacterium]